VREETVNRRLPGFLRDTAASLQASLRGRSQQITLMQIDAKFVKSNCIKSIDVGDLEIGQILGGLFAVGDAGKRSQPDHVIR
jgi:hypothetical protein